MFEFNGFKLNVNTYGNTYASYNKNHFAVVPTQANRFDVPILEATDGFRGNAVARGPDWALRYRSRNIMLDLESAKCAAVRTNSLRPSTLVTALRLCGDACFILRDCVSFTLLYRDVGRNHEVADRLSQLSFTLLRDPDYILLPPSMNPQTLEQVTFVKGNPDALQYVPVLRCPSLDDVGMIQYELDHATEQSEVPF